MMALPSLSYSLRSSNPPPNRSVCASTRIQTLVFPPGLGTSKGETVDLLSTSPAFDEPAYCVVDIRSPRGTTVNWYQSTYYTNAGSYHIQELHTLQHQVTYTREYCQTVCLSKKISKIRRILILLLTLVIFLDIFCNKSTKTPVFRR